MSSVLWRNKAQSPNVLHQSPWADSQERIYGLWGEICLGPAEEDKIFEGWGFFSFFSVNIAEMKDANPFPRDQHSAKTPSSPGSQTWACKGKLI